MRELGLGPCFLEPAQGTMAQYEGKHGPARYGYGPCLGQGIRQVGDLDAVPGGIAREAASSLPPPFFRWNAQRGMPLHFVAIGSKILAMPPMEEKRDTDHLDVGGACFDVRTGCVVFVPRHGDPVYFQIGSRLFTLGCSRFQLLDLLPLALDGDPRSTRRQQWSWRDLPMPPFLHSMRALSHVLLPQEDQTILVGVGFLSPSSSSTYSFRIAEDGSSAWKCLGNWGLPFHGRGYFDPKLNAMIGLSMDGRICSCQLVSDHCPDVKYCRENLFSRDARRRHPRLHGTEKQILPG
uniref:Uncharacterized protein n=1 Tax=Oryza nivara TaxID=4536 RepID=A0A0E0GEE6_ORYNI